MTVGWIGLGEMGLPMAGNLVQAGYQVIGHDLDAAAVAAATDRGIRAAGSLPSLVAAADVLIAMVRTTAQMNALVLGDEGLIAHGARSIDLIVMSTMDPDSLQQLAQEADARAGLTVVDAPVSGGVRGAEAATLSIMAAGPEAAVSRARALLDVLGADSHVIGTRVGAGQAAKLANQVMMAFAIAGSYEGLALSRSYGVADDKVVDAVGGGTGASWPLAHWDWMRSLWEEYEPDNALDILEKDLRAVLSTVSARDADMPATTAVGDRLMALWAAARAAADRR